MIVPFEGHDDLGQQATASITFLRYSLELAYRGDDTRLSLGGLEIEREELVHINLGDARRQLWFPHSKEWRASAIRGRRSAEFISTIIDEGGQRKVRLHQDFGGQYKGGGRPTPRLAASLPRTVLSSANATENKTALLRGEMQSWRLLQLEPAALASPMRSQLLLVWAATVPIWRRRCTIWRKVGRGRSRRAVSDERGTYATVANRLLDLIDDVRAIHVDRDEQRDTLDTPCQRAGRNGSLRPSTVGWHAPISGTGGYRARSTCAGRAMSRRTGERNSSETHPRDAAAPQGHCNRSQ